MKDMTYALKERIGPPSLFCGRKQKHVEGCFDPQKWERNSGSKKPPIKDLQQFLHGRAFRPGRRPHPGQGGRKEGK